MTPQERAEKILPQLKWFVEYNENGFPYLLAQIEEAEREAYKRGEQSQKSCEKSYAEGFRAAREKAKEIAEEFDQSCGCLPKCDSYGHEDLCTVANTEPTIAQRIGEMEP